MKNQDRVRRKVGSKEASAQARSQTRTRAAKGLKTYRVFTAKAGKTDMTRWKDTGLKQARSPLDAARRLLREFKRVAVCRFTKGDTDYLFDLVKPTHEKVPIPPPARPRPVSLEPAAPVPVAPMPEAPTPAPDAPATGEAWKTWNRLETAKREVFALHHALITLLDNGEQQSGEIVAGLQSLGWRTQTELDAIFEAMRPWVSADRQARGLPALPEVGRAA